MSEINFTPDDVADITDVIDALDDFIEDQKDKVKPAQMLSLLVCAAAHIAFDHAPSIKEGLELIYEILKLKIRLYAMEKNDE